MEVVYEFSPADGAAGHHGATGKFKPDGGRAAVRRISSAGATGLPLVAEPCARARVGRRQIQSADLTYPYPHQPSTYSSPSELTHGQHGINMGAESSRIIRSWYKPKVRMAQVHEVEIDTTSFFAAATVARKLQEYFSRSLSVFGYTCAFLELPSAVARHMVLICHSQQLS